MPLNKFVFQPAIGLWFLSTGFRSLRVLLSNTMMLAQIISERQMSDRLFTSRSKYMHVMRAIVVSLDVVTPAGNPVLASQYLA